MKRWKDRAESYQRKLQRLQGLKALLREHETAGVLDKDEGEKTVVELPFLGRLTKSISCPSEGKAIKRLHGENCAESFGI
jgi:hypothetical protein